MNSEWEPNYHPFPEMSRFLNSHSRIHQPPSRSSYSLLGYICSIANNEDKLNEIGNDLGKNYQTLVMTIIRNECSNSNQRYKRTTINIKRKYFPRIFLRKNIDNYYKIS